MGVKGMPKLEESFKFFHLVGNINGAKEGQFDNNVKKFFASLQWHQKQGHNVIISTEHFASLAMDGAKALNNWSGATKTMFDGFRVKAVMVNRNLVDWLPSIYYQHHMLKKPPPAIQSFLQSKLAGWGEASNQTKPKKFNDHLDHRWLLDFWSNLIDLEISDFYSEDGDLFHRFLCHHIPKASGTCEILDNQKQEEGVMRENATLTTNATSIHTRRGKSLQNLRVLFFALETHQFLLNATGLSEKEAKQARNKQRGQFLSATNKLFELYGVLNEGSYFSDCTHPDVEARLKEVSTSFMQSYSKQQHGTVMSGSELETAVAAQNALFEKNRVKYCDVNLERFFGNETIREHLLQNMTHIVS
ncbi:MAG: hypothetical protein SGILL_000338 [Bacillariaceae sp.]